MRIVLRMVRPLCCPAFNQITQLFFSDHSQRHPEDCAQDRQKGASERGIDARLWSAILASGSKQTGPPEKLRNDASLKEVKGVQSAKKRGGGAKVTRVDERDQSYGDDEGEQSQPRLARKSAGRSMGEVRDRREASSETGSHRSSSQSEWMNED